MTMPGMTPFERLRAIQPTLRRFQTAMDQWKATLPDQPTEKENPDLPTEKEEDA